jgi:cell division protein FtsQ
MQQVGQGRILRRDPAPSRWAFRFQRLWLTPLFRALLRVGVPIVTMAVLGMWLLSDIATRDVIEEKFAELRRSVAERPEFLVRVMAIDGTSEDLANDIREIAPVDFPVSSFDLDMEQMQVLIEGLDAVDTAELRIRPGGILQIDVSERTPAIVWRVGRSVELLDATGRRVAALGSRRDRANLPLVVGTSADRAVPEALALFAASAPLADRVRGLARIGERRWDLVLDRDQRIMLPEQRPVDALEQVIALDQAQDLLARDLSAVDMRNILRPTLRIASRAVEQLRLVKALELGDSDQ